MRDSAQYTDGPEQKYLSIDEARNTGSAEVRPNHSDTDEPCVSPRGWLWRASYENIP